MFSFKTLTSALLVSLAAQGAMARTCTSEAGLPDFLDANQELTLSPVSNQGGITVSGKIKIVDKCNFELVGFAVTQGTLPAGTRVWGSFINRAFNATISEKAVTSAASQTFTMTTVDRGADGAGVAMSEINAFMIVDATESGKERTIAEVAIPGAPAKTTSGGTNTGGTTQTTKTSASPSTSPTSSAEKMGAAAGLSFAMLMSYFLSA